MNVDRGTRDTQATLIFSWQSAPIRQKTCGGFQGFWFSQQRTKEYFLESDPSIAIGEPPRRIHILTGIAAVTFDECFKDRVYFKSDGLNVPFIGLDALIKTKLALKRDQDRLDLKRL